MNDSDENNSYEDNNYNDSNINNENYKEENGNDVYNSIVSLPEDQSEWEIQNLITEILKSSLKEISNKIHKNE